jgi:hypothetical protein
MLNERGALGFTTVSKFIFISIVALALCLAPEQ